MEFSKLIWSIVLIANLYFLRETECIYNGDIVKNLKDYRYVVSLLIKDVNENNEEIVYQCGGTILNDNYILTAAHCVSNKATRQFAKGIKILAHSFKNHKTMQGIERHALKTHVLEEYFRDGYDDIAVIELDRSLNLAKRTKKLLAATLPRNPIDFEDMDLLIAGYGDNKIDKKGQPDSDGKLRSLEVKKTDYEDCGNVKGGFQKLYYCVAVKYPNDDKKQKVGVGDSGGPLVVKTGLDSFEIVGVLSQRPDRVQDHEMNRPGIYMQVAEYLDTLIDPVLGNPLIDDREIVTHEFPQKTSCFR